MTGICIICGKVFDGTEEETSGPDCTCSFACLKAWRGRWVINLDRFFMVYIPGRGAPEAKHETIKEAVEEATRLTRKERKTAYILKVVGKTEIEEAPVKFTEIL